MCFDLSFSFSFSSSIPASLSIPVPSVFEYFDFLSEAELHAAVSVGG